MLQAMLDTSSLIALALAQKEQDIPKSDSRTFWSAHGGIDGAIEALVLYDELLLDGPSMQRNAERLPELMDLARTCKLVALEEGIERYVYKKVLTNHVAHIRDPGPGSIDLFRMPTEHWMAAELGVEQHYPSARWRDIASELTEDAAEVANALRVKLGEHTPYSGAACLLLLRILYYDMLHQLYSVDLILHPLKGSVYETSVLPDGGDHSILVPLPSANILDLFDDSVRKAFYDRKRKWLGRDDLTFQIPILTSYILNRCKSWRDLFDVVFETRESKQAQQFRSAVDDLLEAVERHDNKIVDEILSALEGKVDSWTKALKQEGPKKKINLSVPLLNVGTEFEVPDRKFRKSKGEKILIFLHELILHA